MEGGGGGVGEEGGGTLNSHGVGVVSVATSELWGQGEPRGRESSRLT